MIIVASTTTRKIRRINNNNSNRKKKPLSYVNDHDIGNISNTDEVLPGNNNTKIKKEKKFIKFKSKR